MNEIKVEPYIPDEDYDNPAMVVDFYEFTMANCLFLHGFKNTTLVFDMFFRKNPDNQGYSISAGQRKLTRFLLDYHFNDQDIHWLRTKGMSEEFCEYLRTYTKISPSQPAGRCAETVMAYCHGPFRFS